MADPVRVGQIWGDVPPRLAGRTFEVISVGQDYVVAKVLTNSHLTQRLLDAGAPGKKDQRETLTRISRPRLRSGRIYRLLEDA